MRVLAVNCGSSTLKFDLVDLEPGPAGRLQRIAQGSIERVGGEATCSLSLQGDSTRRTRPVADHGSAFREAVQMLDASGLASDIKGIGHRVVHGGAVFDKPAIIDQAIVGAIQAASELAPLHNRPALEAITAARARFGEAMPTVATFDTAFFAQLPEIASCYALPRDLTETLTIRRFGFHGLAHRYMVDTLRFLRPEIEKPRLITLQLGNGCSATASLDGRPLDTSMGFTPLEGLIMGTRSGDLDPSLPLFLARRLSLTVDEVESILNTQSGLLGLSGLSNDMRDLIEAAAAGHSNAELAIDAFCYRIRKYVGAYMAVLGRADAVIFGGGIGENSPEVRERVCGAFSWAGLELDRAKNARVSGPAERISSEKSHVEAWVVSVDEAIVIARDTADCLN